ncbi:MAG: sulfatase, partial [Candidatus Poribacteria bacterium]
MNNGDRPRPNILFAIADDASHMGAYGHEFLSTPHFDRVAAEGVLFTHAYTTNPKCAPSRASILTGRHTWQLEEASCHFGVFPAKFAVYPSLLEATGYHVGHTGKGWAPGDYEAGGFTRNPAGPDYHGARLDPPTTRISAKDYAGNFDRFLDERPADSPFCFWYGGHEPHRAYEEGSGVRAGKNTADITPPAYLPDDEIVRSDLLDYAFEIEWFDTHLGRMLAKLEEIGELDDTLIVVTSDNGMPFPRVKGQMYEADFNMPFAVRWGHGVDGGRVVTDFVSFRDIAPTFVEAAGLAPPESITGRSFLDVVTSSDDG